jgi:hypothetical protein
MGGTPAPGMGGGSWIKESPLPLIYYKTPPQKKSRNHRIYFVYYSVHNHEKMITKTTKISKNVHKISLTGTHNEIAVLSDLHWDNPKCDRDLLKKHLDHCLKHKIPVVITGDLFCLMQGRGDKRGNKSDVLPEHNNFKYLDSIVETAVEWFTPYASILTVIGYGNHETAIIKWQETDILQRFVDLLNITTGSEVYTGGYGGWIIYEMNIRNNTSVTFKHKYFHGSGGGGIVTKGAINLTRALETYEGFDLFSMGHIHENSCRNDSREVLHINAQVTEIRLKQIHHCITGTYKEEYEDGSKGWHVERGAPPKPLGGRIVVLEAKRGRTETKKSIDSKGFPL